ncbi:MAG: hypothetical protein K6G64_02965 [Eubacterium sp.]|nr:hypothetical protein [Eubacterium sp.]
MDSKMFKSRYNDRLDTAKSRNHGKDKIGEYIKEFSVWILIINVIGSVLLACGNPHVVGISPFLRDSDEFSFSILFVGVISSLVEFVILYGIGETVDRVISIDNEIKEIKK